MQMTHFCKKCQTEKSSSEFSTLKRTYKDSTYTYLQSSCKPCITLHYAVWRKKKGKTYSRAKAYSRGDDQKASKGATSWDDFKGYSRIEEYKIYPTCETCPRKYIPELGCIWCSRIDVYGKSPIAKVN